MTASSLPRTPNCNCDHANSQRLEQGSLCRRKPKGGWSHKSGLGYRPRAWVTGTVLLVLVITTGACSIFRRGEGGQTLGTESVLTGEAVLVCGQECSERGQCGTADQGQMVLLSTSGPVTSGHDMAVLANTSVLIERQEVRTVIQVSTSEELQVPYYMVNVPDRGSAWVAGWCVAQ